MSDSPGGHSSDELRVAEVLLGGALPPQGSSGPCLSPEDLAAYIDGRGTANERAAVAAHIERCEACYGVFVATAELAVEFDKVVARPLPVAAPRRSPAQWFGAHRVASFSALGAAAALVLAVWAGGRFGRAADPLEVALARLDQSLGEFRPVDARLTGASYRPAPPVTRAAAPSAEAPLEVRDLANAAERAALAAVPEARAHAMAKVYLVKGEPDRAVGAVASFVSRSSDARFLSDASAAYLARARDGDYAQALEAAARAVDLNPGLVEAWFNLGLAYEALGQHPAAAKAWERAIELEPTSGWASEAAKRRAQAPKGDRRLPETSMSRTKSQNPRRSSLSPSRISSRGAHPSSVGRATRPRWRRC